MSDINKVYITGRATRRPDLKQTNGRDWCFLSIACNEYDFKTKQQSTSFISVMVGGKIAAIVADRVDVGDPLVIEGHIKIRKGDRDKGTKDEAGIVADNVIFATKPTRGEQPSEEGLI